MKYQERQLFKALCDIRSQELDEELLAYATPEVLGQLFYNRMAGIAYGTLKRHRLLGKVNREFRNSLKGSFEQNVERNESYNLCLTHVSNILSQSDCKFAMLKGAALCNCYPVGYRTSNDIDLLLLADDVTQVGEMLSRNGFKQGYIRNEVFVPASRIEIVQSKMMRGETVPYIKEMNLPWMKYLEVDLNFSLDYKNGDLSALRSMLEMSQKRTFRGVEILTLNLPDFLIHLCGHLYKEATTMAWVKMNRDMTLYKYCDIYLLFSEMDNLSTELFFARAAELNMEKICAFSVLQTADLFDFDNYVAVERAKEILRKDPEFIHTVISPEEKKEYVYKEKNVQKRFFATNRTKYLEEKQL